MGSGKSGSVTMPQANAVTQTNSQPAMGSPDRNSQVVGMGPAMVSPNRYSQTVGMGGGWDNARLGQSVGNPLAAPQAKGYGGKVSPKAIQQTQPNQQSVPPVDTGSNNYY